MIKKTPTPAFEVYFDGPSLYPEQIPLNALSRTLSAVQRIALAKDDEEGNEEEAIRLLNVKRGSAIFQCFAPRPDVAVQRIRLVGAIIEKPELADQAVYAFNPIEDLSAIARSLGCRITIRNPETQGVYAAIGPDSFKNISSSMFVKGETTVAGHVVRVGGATRTRCVLRVDFQRHLLYCKVANEDVAREIGQHLYEDIVADGTAFFLKTSWKIAKFTVASIYQPKTGSILKTLQDVRKISGNAWRDVVDPKAYLEEVAGES
ncbi:MAG: hypothetical protein FWD61_03460 [Phycisphaerales bacterium]|nr:hypothetical protein [Phycisphaerales bacterium]